MKKRFIVCIEKSIKEQDKIFIDYLRNNSVGWWHWLSNTWLISDPNGQLNSSILRDKLREIYNDERNIIFEITNTQDTWSGFGPIAGEKNMFRWLKDNWKK